MTDMELLELAAKAAKILVQRTNDGRLSIPVVSDGMIFWDPLTDDGDALRLAVKLRLTSPLTWPDVSVEASKQWAENAGVIDWYAATRRAIVRTAAEIGNGMNE